MQLEAQPKLNVQSIAGELAGRFQGDAIGPDHPDYAKRSIVWNAMVNKRPRKDGSLFTAKACTVLRRRGGKVADIRIHADLNGL